jgi:hypothetical protein
MNQNLFTVSYANAVTPDVDYLGTVLRARNFGYVNLGKLKVGIVPFTISLVTLDGGGNRVLTPKFNEPNDSTRNNPNLIVDQPNAAISPRDPAPVSTGVGVGP